MEYALQEKAEDNVRAIENIVAVYDINVARSLISQTIGTKRITSDLFYRRFSLLHDSQSETGIRTFRFMAYKVL